MYAATLRTDDHEDFDERVEGGWEEWFNRAKGDDRIAINAQIEEWLDQEPDWANEWEYFYKTGNAQGAAYDHFLREDPDVMDALSVVLIEGDCPGSSYFAAELHMSLEEANEVAEANGWQIRFVAEGAA